MKKEYSKPIVVFENFTLSTNIAGTCESIVGNPSKGTCAVLGTGGILLPWALILLLIGNLKLAAGIAALYLIITFVRQTLEPKIVGAQIGLHPLATLIAMLLGLGLFGLVGLLAFPVTLSVLNAMHRTKQARMAAEAAKDNPTEAQKEEKPALIKKKKHPMSRVRSRGK